MHASTILLVALLLVCACKLLLKKTREIPQHHDVFLSFRGEDTRAGFTDFLYNSLVDAGFHVFRDNNTLPVGEEIGPKLLQAIRNCTIAIPIISEQYAQSRWCLRELTEIMDCHAKHHKSVFPVFYKVDVVEVLEQLGNFGKALRKHKRSCSLNEVQKWESALTSVASIRGWTSQTIANGHEGELVKMVIQKVSSVLKTTWVERLPVFPILMSYPHIRSVYLYLLEKKRSQVFLAFHGPDTRCGLVASLYKSITDAGISVFRIDDPSLIGKNGSSEIRNAIDHCKISIPILSENFASSPWCLNELAQMIECKNTKGQEILPIFYKVKPSDVRDRLHSFRDDMRRQKNLFKRSKYEQWKGALKEVGSSKGWESRNIAHGDEAVLAKQVVQEVSKLLIPQTYDRPVPIH